jgi:hypothetical protein
MTNQQKPPIIFRYKNWQGDVGIRHVMPIEIWYGHTEFHQTDQWLLKAMDVDKNAERNFAINDIIEFIKEEV